MSPKKQLTLLIVAAACLTSFLTGYLLTQPNNNGSDNILAQQKSLILDRFNGTTPAPTTQPVPSGVFQIENQAVIAPTAALNNDAVVYYERDSGHVNSIEPATQSTTVISATNLTHLTNAIWSNDAQQAIEIYSTATSTIYKYFNYGTNEEKTLGSNILSAAFSPDGSRLVTAQNNGGETDIAISQQDGSQPSTILKTQFSQVSLSWPADHVLSLIAQTDNGPIVYQLSDTGDVTDLIESPGGQIQTLWSPDASQVLYSIASSSSEELFVYTLASQNTQPVDIQASAEQCAWQNESSIICAGQQNHNGVIVQINPNDGTYKDLFSDMVVVPTKLFLTRGGEFAILENQGDSTLYAYQLH